MSGYEHMGSTAKLRTTAGELG